MIKLIHYLITFLVLVPTTLATGVLGLVGLTVAYDDLSHGKLVTIAIIPLVLAGWFGIAVLWRLDYFFRYPSISSLPKPHISWLGLACGSSVSVYFVIESGGSLFFKLMFFGWPLIAAIFFSVRLITFKETRDGDRIGDLSSRQQANPPPRETLGG